MKRLGTGGLLACILLATQAGAASPQRAEPDPRFEVEGEAVILRKNLARAQEAAIRDAMRRAVFRAVRGDMGAEGVAQNRRAIEATLLRLSHEYVRSYRFLGRQVDPGGRRLKVRLEVVVDLSAVDQALRSLRLAQASKGDVRILLLVEERVLGRAGRRAPAAGAIGFDGPGAAERRLTYRFAQSGYTVVDPRAQREPARPGQISDAIRGNVDTARMLGGLCGCQLVVTARAVVERERSGALVGLANARVLRVSDGAVIAIRSNHVRLRSGDRARGFETALATAGARLAAALLPEVRKAFPPPRRRPPRAAGQGR